MPCPKSKFSTFIRFLPRYGPNPESLVTIGQTDLSPQILVPKRFPVPAGPKNQNLATKKIPPGDNPKDSINTGVQLSKCHKDKICCPKIWSQKGFQYQKSTMPCPKSKFSTFIRFLPRYRPNPESFVTIGQTDLSLS